MTDAETIIARVLLDHEIWDTRDHNCTCGQQASDPTGHVAAEVARALRDAALLPEGTTRVEWGVKSNDQHHGGRPVRRTRTTYADHVTEWEPAE